MVQAYLFHQGGPGDIAKTGEVVWILTWITFCALVLSVVLIPIVVYWRFPQLFVSGHGEQSKHLGALQMEDVRWGQHLHVE